MGTCGETRSDVYATFIVLMRICIVQSGRAFPGENLLVLYMFARSSLLFPFVRRKCVLYATCIRRRLYRATECGSWLRFKDYAMDTERGMSRERGWQGLNQITECLHGRVVCVRRRVRKIAVIFVVSLFISIPLSRSSPPSLSSKICARALLSP